MSFFIARGAVTYIAPRTGFAAPSGLLRARAMAIIMLWRCWSRHGRLVCSTPRMTRSILTGGGWGLMPLVGARRFFVDRWG